MSSLHPRLTGAEPARRASAAWVRGLVGTLLAAILPAATWAAQPSSRPYLALVASPMLRFAPPPPDRTNEPVLPEALHGALQPEQPVVEAESLGASPEPEAPVEPASGPAHSPEPASDPVAPAAEISPADPGPTVSILPDDLSSRTTAEDFLPYFLPPPPPSGPRSQATYQQR